MSTGMEHACLRIEYNDDAHEASCASQHACMRISDGYSCTIGTVDTWIFVGLVIKSK